MCENQFTSQQVIVNKEGHYRQYGVKRPKTNHMQMQNQFKYPYHIIKNIIAKFPFALQKNYLNFKILQ